MNSLTNLISEIFSSGFVVIGIILIVLAGMFWYYHNKAGDNTGKKILIVVAIIGVIIFWNNYKTTQQEKQDYALALALQEQIVQNYITQTGQISFTGNGRNCQMGGCYCSLFKATFSHLNKCPNPDCKHSAIMHKN